MSTLSTVVTWSPYYFLWTKILHAEGVLLPNFVELDLTGFHVASARNVGVAP